MGADRWLKRASGLLVPRLNFGQPYPCPGCCPDAFDCDYFSDDFARSDNTNLGGGWTEDSGDWSIDTVRLTTPDTTAVCTCTTAATLPYVATAQFSGSIGDYARVIVDYTDTSNYIYAEIKFAAGAAAILSLTVRSGGSDTELDSKTIIATGASMQMRVCVKANHVNVNTKVGAGAWLPGLAAYTTVTSGVAGVGTGATATGVYFTSFALQAHADQDASCPECAVPCDGCIDSLTPELFQVVLTGIGAGDADCPSLNGTWILSPRKGACQWISDGADYRIQAANCGDKTCVTLSILAASTICGDDVADNYAIDVQALGCVNPVTDCSAGCGWFRHSQVDKYDCRNISGLSLRRESTGVCDITGATCTVTAL